MGTVAPQSGSFDRCIADADKYYRTAAWEEASKALNAAAALPQSSCNDGLVAIQRRRGEIERRKGNYNKATVLLEQAVDVNGVTRGIQYLEIIGELGAVYVQQDEFAKARDLFQEQLDNAEALSEDANIRQSRMLSVAVEAQACRAIGNLGLAKYHIATTAPVRRRPLLYEAIADLEKRVARSEALQADLKLQGDVADYRFAASIWQSLGLGRLTLCFTALGEHEQALQYGQAAVGVAASSTDPVIRGMSRFYYGYALFAAGMPEQARRQWDFSTETDLCASVIALCKEPSEAHSTYLRKMRSLGVRFDRYDENGYTALDYAVLAGHEKCSAIVIRGLRDEMDERYPDDEARADQQVDIRRSEARRRKQYREIFQSTFRPLLGAHMPGTTTDDRLLALRKIYAEALRTDLQKREVFDKFNVISYAAFKSLGKLPNPNNAADMRTLYEHARKDPAQHLGKSEESPYVIFFSYEWLGKMDGRPGEPDDSMSTQFRRMIEAVESLVGAPREITGTTHLRGDRVFIWLDVASIDQINQEPGAQDRGVSALPLFITLCNTMISLVDDTYFNRAWCAVEVLLIQSLLSYGHHRHLEHRVGGQNGAQGQLFSSHRLSQIQDVATNDSKYGITKPEDRASIRFLARQSQLLANM